MTMRDEGKCTEDQKQQPESRTKAGGMDEYRQRSQHREEEIDLRVLNSYCCRLPGRPKVRGTKSNIEELGHQHLSTMAEMGPSKELVKFDSFFWIRLG